MKQRINSSLSPGLLIDNENLLQMLFDRPIVFDGFRCLALIGEAMLHVVDLRSGTSGPGGIISLFPRKIHARDHHLAAFKDPGLVVPDRYRYPSRRLLLDAYRTSSETTPRANDLGHTYESARSAASDAHSRPCYPVMHLPCYPLSQILILDMVGDKSDLSRDEMMM